MNAADELERVIVVLGAHSHEVLCAVEFGRAEPIVCEGWSEGIAASLRHALRALPDADPLVIALGDQPGLTPAAVSAVACAALADPCAQAARAVYEGVPGHPVAIRSPLREAVMRLRGDSGAGRLLGGVPEVECARLASGVDVDTTEQLEGLRS
jgi:CTP:molybdopterin cytidylyltransferase MocA